MVWRYRNVFSFKKNHFTMQISKRFASYRHFDRGNSGWSDRVSVVGVSLALWYFRYIASIFLTLHKCLCYKYAPSSKITQTCFFLSYYSLLIIWHAVQCFCYHLCLFFNKSVSIERFSESVNIATAKRLLLKSETNTETETNFQILPIYYLFWHKKC